MHTLIITKLTHELLKAQAPRGMTPGARQPDGAYTIVVDDEVWERLWLIDKNPDRAIQALCLGQVGNAG